MALSYYEQNLLKRAMEEYFSEHSGDTFTIQDLSFALDSGYSTTTIRSFITRNAYRFPIEVIGKKGSANLYQIRKILTLYSWEKNREIITFYNEDKTASISYNFATGEISSSDYFIRGNRVMITMYQDVIRGEVAEWIFSYPDLFDDYDDMPNTCPKGYINFLKERNLKINSSSLRDFCTYQLTGKIDDVVLLSVLKNFSIEELQEIAPHFDGIKYALDHEYLVDFFEANNSTWGSGLYSKIANFLKTYIKNCNTLGEKPVWKNILKNATIAQRLVAMKEHNEEAESVARYQHCVPLAFENNEFIVVVPTTFDEFKAEANYQQNCVCAYYYPKVVDERTHVVFIRRKSDINKPYITCEVDNNGRIVQYLTRFNNHVSDKSAIEFKNLYKAYLDALNF